MADTKNGADFLVDAIELTEALKHPVEYLAGRGIEEAAIPPLYVYDERNSSVNCATRVGAPIESVISWRCPCCDIPRAVFVYGPGGDPGTPWPGEPPVSEAARGPGLAFQLLATWEKSQLAVLNFMTEREDVDTMLVSYPVERDRSILQAYYLQGLRRALLDEWERYRGGSR